MTEAAILEGTPHDPLPATAAAHTTLQLMDAPIIPCAVPPTGTVSPHPAHITSPKDVTHITPQTRGSLHSSQSHCTPQESQLRKAKQCPRPSTTP